MKTWTNHETTLLLEEYPKQGTNIPELLKKFTLSSISHKAQRLNIKYEAFPKRRNKRINYSEQIKEITDGLLLGDGGFEGSSPTTSSIGISQTESRKEWLYDIKQNYNRLGVLTSKVRLRYKEHEHIINGYKVHTKDAYTFQTYSYVDFKSEKPKWGCINYKKTEIPKDCSITLQTLALFYMGDGTLRIVKRRSGKKDYMVSFATLCFSEKSLKYFIKRLEKEYGWKLRLNDVMKLKDNSFGYIINMSKRENVYDFLNITKKYRIDCFAYKWRALEDEEWINREMPNFFTDAELDIMMYKYSLQGSNMPELLKNHSEQSIRDKARKLNLKTGRCGFGVSWLEEEITKLKNNYFEKGTTIPKLQKKHSNLAIRKKAAKLNLKYNGKNTWTTKNQYGNFDRKPLS